MWKLANRIKGPGSTLNSLIHGSYGVKYDVGKATDLADCLEDQFRPNAPDDEVNQVKQRVQEFCNSTLNSCHYQQIEKIIKHLKHAKASGNQ